MEYLFAVCSTVYIHLYWGSQKTESIILGSCFCWDHLQLGNSHIVSMILRFILFLPQGPASGRTKGHGRSINVP